MNRGDFPCEVGEEYLVAEPRVEVDARVVEHLDDPVHAVRDEGHDDAEDAEEEPVLHFGAGLAPDVGHHLGQRIQFSLCRINCKVCVQMCKVNRRAGLFPLFHVYLAARFCLRSGNFSMDAHHGGKHDGQGNDRK